MEGNRLKEFSDKLECAEREQEQKKIQINLIENKIISKTSSLINMQSEIDRHIRERDHVKAELTELTFEMDFAKDRQNNLILENTKIEREIISIQTELRALNPNSNVKDKERYSTALSKKTSKDEKLKMDKIQLSLQRKKISENLEKKN